VAGLPVTQGSKRAYVVNGRPVLTEHAGDHLKAWRYAIAAEGARVWPLDRPLFAGPLSVRLVFGLRKPASAPKTQRTWPVTARSGDVDKLARAALDALTGVIWMDDGQVVELRVSKDYGPPGVEVEVRSVT
jgi:crossover junction endodeoxyribonuclease RusA